MRVVLLTNILSPYRKVFYDKLYTCFKEKDIDFKVLVMAETEPDREWSYNDYKGDYSELLLSKTVTVQNIYFHFNKNLAKRLYKIRPDILIASGSYISPSVLKAIRLKKKLNYKLYFWSESHMNELRDYSSLKIKIRNLIRKNIYKKFDSFWYAGSKSLEFILNYAANSNYYFIPNLVDHNFFKEASNIDEAAKLQLREKLNISVHDYVFILPARLIEVKGIIPFINLFNNCNYKNNATIIILGDGELKNEIQHLVLNKMLNIRLAGYMNQADLIEYYKIADCFLLPSLSDANPLTCIEALWAGLPLLLSEHVGNYPEVVKNGQNGYVFSYDDTNEAINLIDKIITSSDEWKENAKKVSLNLANEMFEPDKAVTHLVESMISNLDRD